MRRCGVVVLWLVASAASWRAHAGHEAPLYPSYYPQEIRIEQADPAQAGRLLPSGKLHAYIGAAPDFAGPAPPSVRFVESLESFLLVRLNPASPAAQDARTACTAAGALIQAIAGSPQRFVVHPYPINGYHADYLHHVDRVEAAKARFLADPALAVAALKVRAEGELTKLLPAAAATFAVGADWDIEIGAVARDALLAGHAFISNGMVGPPWLKAGWYHAYLLLASSLTDSATREQAAALAAALKAGRFGSPAERINRERQLVALLTAGCRSVVAGFAARREYYSADYSEGVENIAYDSHAGLNAAIFVRTVKLKDFPWNGWLRLGVAAPAAAAWNPFAGFDDEAGRLMWWALGDPAMFPEPYGAGWSLNRFSDVKPAAGR